MGKFADALKRWHDEGGAFREAPAPLLSARPEQGAAPQGISSPAAGRLPFREPSRRASPSGHLLINNGAAPAIIEQYKMLRTHLLHYQGGRPPRTVLVTSTLRGEGKSSVAANLAISVARSVKEHVLLMDCDLREPSLHALFGLRPVAGLSDYLRREMGLAGLLLRTQLAKLSLLPAGPKAADAAELLASDKMRLLLGEVKERYEDRLIILDSAPLLPTTDPALLAPQVDAILLVVRAGMANRELIARMVDTVCSEKILGVVFNAVEPSPASWARGYYGSAYGSD